MRRCFIYLFMLLSTSPAVSAWSMHHGLPVAAPHMLPANDSAPDTEAVPSAQVSAETEKKVRLFLDWFVDAAKTPSEQASLFTDDAKYYEQGAVGKSAIRRDVERYVRHWPYRSYQVAEITYITPDPMSRGRVFVAYTIDFEVANRVRSIKGKADYGAVITNLHDAPKVEAIKERILHRKPVNSVLE